MLVLPIMILIASIIMYFSAFLNTMIHPRWILSIATLAAVGGTVLASMTTSFISFVICYCVGMAIAFGLSFTTPFAVGWSYFPRHHGKVSGVM